MLLLTNRSYQPFLTLCEIHFPSTDQIYRPQISDIWRKKKIRIYWTDILCHKNGVDFLQGKLHLDLQGICGFFLRTDGLYKMFDSIKSYCSQ